MNFTDALNTFIAALALIVSILTAVISWKRRTSPWIVLTAISKPLFDKYKNRCIYNNFVPQYMFTVSNIGEGRILELSSLGYQCQALMFYIDNQTCYQISYVSQEQLESGNIVLVIYHGNWFDEQPPSIATAILHYWVPPARLKQCHVQTFAINRQRLGIEDRLLDRNKQYQQYTQKQNKRFHHDYHTADRQIMQYDRKLDPNQDFYFIYFNEPVRDSSQNRLR